MTRCYEKKKSRCREQQIWFWIFSILEDGYDISTIQKILGHSDIRTTMIYTHVARKNRLGLKGPLD